MANRSDLAGWVERLHRARVLVVGDVMLDCYVRGVIERISPEAPVPVFRSGLRRTELGGAGNVVRNLKALSVRVDFVSVVGDDAAGEEIRDKLGSLSGVTASLVVAGARPTTRKTRFMAGPQQVLRVDEERDGARLANAAAGIVVGKVGTAAVRPAELVRALHSQKLLGSESKVVDLETAVETAEAWRRKGLKVGLTNGVFDLLHEGHLGLISQARRVCDRLIVAVNGDQSVQRIKGKNPAQHEATRSNIMASLSAVDLVVVFQDETPVPLLRAVQPDVLIKGGNYRPGEVVGADVVEGYGGRIFLAEVQEPRNLEIRRLTGGTF